MSPMPAHLRDAARLAERTQRLLKDDLGRYGFRYEMDARLRPEGRKGQLVWTWTLTPPTTPIPPRPGSGRC